ncbi:MAG TPA: thermonuclease family protein [Rhizomicrobium sp.]
MISIRSGSLLLACTLAAAPVAAADEARVVRVEQDGALDLKDGRQAVAEGIRLPQGRNDHASQSFADEALTAMRALVVGKTVTLVTAPPEQDRYGRLRAQIVANGDWVQGELLERGMARVALAPAHTECAAALYAAENDAREAQRGLWASSDYAVRNPMTLWHDMGTFQIVEGKVLNASLHDGRAYLNYGIDWRTDFTVTISPDDMKLFRKDNIDPRDYAGKFIRVRGFVDWQNGPEIEIANPETIENIDAQNKKPGLASGLPVSMPMKC